MKRTSILIAILALVAACAESGQDTGATEEAADTTAAADPAALRSEIEAANDAFEEGMAAGADAGTRAVYTEDAVIYPPDGEPVEGVDAIAGFWGGLEEQMGSIDVELTTVEVAPAGEGMAWEVGEWTIPGPDGPVDEGTYMVIWKSTPDGWKLHRDIWNSDVAAAGDGGEGAPASE